MTKQALSFVFAINCLLLANFQSPVSGELKVGAAIVDVTPAQLPVLVNGGMLSRSVGEINTPVSARAIVLDDGKERIAIVVVDSCMMPRDLLDQAKQVAAERTKIKPDRMLISATHTHTAPSTMGALGTNADPTYVPYLREKLAEAIAAAEKNLEPATVGFGLTKAPQYTALRRWVRRPDRLGEDPFGNPTVRANMHAANKWDDVTGQTGPEDPDLQLIAFKSKAGEPIAVLANFSMHYFGDKAISADYFGLFCNGFQQHVESQSSKDEKKDKRFVAALSHGCSGDIWRRDYAVEPEKRFNPTINEFSDGLLKLAIDCYSSIECEDVESIAMAEARIPLKYRLPDTQRLEWANRVIKEMGDREPKDTKEVYAREQIILDQLQSTEIVVQAIRIGDIGIATTPNETYALTGMKLKLQSPLEKQMVIELANGGDGYIPPPEQHVLGGYNTWAARSAGLEVQAEPKIVATGLNLLEEVANESRRQFSQPKGSLTKTMLKEKPMALWRFDELAGPQAHDSSGNQRDGVYEDGVLFFLEGPETDLLCGKGPIAGDVNRSAHFAGGRMQTRIPTLPGDYSVSLWFWNGMPVDARETTGWMFSRDHAHQTSSSGDHLGIGGTATSPGCLIYQHGKNEPVVGKTESKRWTWNHVLLTRNGKTVRVYLNVPQQFMAGTSLKDIEPEIEFDLNSDSIQSVPSIFIGGRSDNHSNWEGRLDEVSIFDRAIRLDELFSRTED